MTWNCICHNPIQSQKKSVSTEVNMDAEEELLSAAAEAELPREDITDTETHVGVQADFSEDNHSEPVGVQVDFGDNGHSDPVGVQVDLIGGDSHCDPIDPQGDVGAICDAVASTDYQLCATDFSGTSHGLSVVVFWLVWFHVAL